MIDFYLIRHAEAELSFKIAELVGGRCIDSMLTERGVLQARALGRRLRDEGVKFDEVHAGNCTRHLDSTILMCEEIGFPYSIIVTDALLELSQGEWEGKRKKKTFTKEIELIQRSNLLDFKAPGGESPRDVGYRMMTYLLGIKDRIDDDSLKKVGIISSANAIRQAIRGIDMLSPSETWKISINHASISQFRYKREIGWETLRINSY